MLRYVTAIGEFNAMIYIPLIRLGKVGTMRKIWVSRNAWKEYRSLEECVPPLRYFRLNNSTLLHFYLNSIISTQIIIYYNLLE